MHGLMCCEKLLHPLMLLLKNIQVCSALLTKKSIIFFNGLVSCTALVKASCLFPRDGVALEAIEEGQILATWQGRPSCSSAENPVRKEGALWYRVKGGNYSALSPLSGSFGREGCTRGGCGHRGGRRSSCLERKRNSHVGPSRASQASSSCSCTRSTVSTACSSLPQRIHSPPPMRMKPSSNPLFFHADVLTQRFGANPSESGEQVNPLLFSCLRDVRQTLSTTLPLFETLSNPVLTCSPCNLRAGNWFSRPDDHCFHP